MRRRALLSGISLAALCYAPARAQSALGDAAVTQAPKLDDTVYPGYTRFALARWGDALLPEAPPFIAAALTPDAAAAQFPYDATIAGLITPPPAQDGIPRLVLALANPEAPARMCFPGGIDQPAVAGKLQGATVLNLQYQHNRWLTVDGGYQSRRITDGTLCQISGPVAASIGATVQGLLGPQGGCPTPWGSVLFAEGDAGPWLTRLAADPATAPRFGWITEIDPLDPLAIPIKRTALGRFSRAAAAATVTPDGRPVVFMSQDAPAGFLFRFVAATSATDGTALDTGTLAAAQINDDQITWMNLGTDIPSLAGALAAASAAGASPFDTPGGIAIGNGAVYLACGGNPARDPADTNALNPRAGDDNGHILVFHPPNGDLTAATFDGEVAIAAGNPATAAFTQYTPGSTAWLKNPRTLNLDATGRLWIGTDQGGKISDTADGLFLMQISGPSKYLVKAVYLAPIGAAIGGAAFHPGTENVFTVVRHPGATPGASFDNPATRWPTLRPGTPPQTTLIALAAG